MSSHYNEKEPRIDLYIYRENDEDVSPLYRGNACCIIINDGKNIFFIGYFFDKENCNINCGEASFKDTNRYFENYYKHLEWTWNMNKIADLDIAEGKGAVYYIWKNLLTLIKKNNNDLKRVIKEIKINAKKAGYYD